MTDLDVIREAVRAELAEHIEPRLVSVATAGRSLGLAETTVWELVGSRRIRSFKVGRRRLIPVAALDEFVAALDQEQCA